MLSLPRALALSLLCALGCERKSAEVRNDPVTTAPSTTAADATVPSVASADGSSDAAADTSGRKRVVVVMRALEPKVTGGLTDETVARVLRASIPRFRACYESGLKRNPALRGSVSIRFVIDATGAVESASASDDTLKDVPVTDCMLSIHRGLTFPVPAGGKVTVTSPMVFDTEEGTAYGDPDAEIGLGTVGGFGHCPCGCDHSEGMVAELRGLDRGAALRAIDDSLHTIGEREDLGYITDRMVRHRLRLLAFGEELGRVGPARFTTIPPIHAEASATTDAATKVRAELVFHGEMTEVVKGKEKLLRAAFLVRLELENGADADITLRPPTLEAKMPLPVSRWYVAGGDGRAWDGLLPAKAKKLVHVIGHAGEAVPPGADVDATIHFETVELHMKTRARHTLKAPSADE